MGEKGIPIINNRLLIYNILHDRFQINPFLFFTKLIHPRYENTVFCLCDCSIVAAAVALHTNKQVVNVVRILLFGTWYALYIRTCFPQVPFFLRAHTTHHGLGFARPRAPTPMFTLGWCACTIDRCRYPVIPPSPCVSSPLAPGHTTLRRIIIGITCLRKRFSPPK